MNNNMPFNMFPNNAVQPMPMHNQMHSNSMLETRLNNIEKQLNMLERKINRLEGKQNPMPFMDNKIGIPHEYNTNYKHDNYMI